MTLAFLWGVLVALLAVAGVWSLIASQKAYERNIARGERPGTIGWSGGDSLGGSALLLVVVAVMFLGSILWLG